MKIKIKKVVSSREVERKDGQGKFPVHQILTEDDEVLEIIGSAEVGKEYEGEIEETQYGKRFRKAQTGRFGQRAAFDPAYLEKKNELNARQTALNCAVAFAAAKIETKEKISGEDILEMAEVNLKWLKGGKIKENGKAKVVTANEDNKLAPEPLIEEEKDEDDEIDLKDVPFD